MEKKNVVPFISKVIMALLIAAIISPVLLSLVFSPAPPETDDWPVFTNTILMDDVVTIVAEPIPFPELPDLYIVRIYYGENADMVSLNNPVQTPGFLTTKADLRVGDKARLLSRKALYGTGYDHLTVVIPIDQSDQTRSSSFEHGSPSNKEELRTNPKQPDKEKP